MEPKELMERARKVFGVVAENIGKEILDKVGPEKFEEVYIEELSKITGNKKLVENILKGE